MKITFALAVFASLAMTSSGRADDKPIFPVMAWNHVNPDPVVLAKMRECGFTVAGFAYAKDLDAVHAAGMKAIVYDARTASYDWTNVDAAVARKNVESLVKEVNAHPAVIGYYLRDEPPAAWFPELEKVASVVRELAPGKWPYINLFPNYAHPSQLHAGGYDDYVARFVATCKPPVISYDHYGLMDDGSLRPQYWQNLEQVRAAAKKSGAAFWNIVLATTHFDYREVTHADFRFQAYSTLAYGGRGLSYFTYFAPPVGNYRMGPIDQYGNATPAWYFLQNVNKQIEKLAPTILKLRSDEVYHFGTIPQGCDGPSAKSLLTGVAGEMMAGDFTHEDGTRYVMIVNKDVVKARPCAPTFRAAPKSVELISAYTGQPVAFEGEQVWLAPGQGALLKLN